MELPDNRAIETARLLLRPLVPEDADALLPIFSDAAVMKYWNTPPWSRRQDALDFISDSNTALADGSALTLGIVCRHGQRLIGKCMLFAYSSSSRRAEIGFGIARPAWGQGYVQEAAAALIGHGFEALGLRRIEAEIDPVNSASARTLERLGFVREGLLRQRWEIAGVISDSAMYGLLHEDWRARNR